MHLVIFMNHSGYIVSVLMCMGEDPISVQIRAVAHLCIYKYKNIFFRDR